MMSHTLPERATFFSSADLQHNSTHKTRQSSPTTTHNMDYKWSDNRHGVQSQDDVDKARSVAHAMGMLNELMFRKAAREPSSSLSTLNKAELSKSPDGCPSSRSSSASDSRGVGAKIFKGSFRQRKISRRNVFSHASQPGFHESKDQLEDEFDALCKDDGSDSLVRSPDFGHISSIKGQSSTKHKATHKGGLKFFWMTNSEVV
jgi:hypothetical protein